MEVFWTSWSDDHDTLDTFSHLSCSATQSTKRRASLSVFLCVRQQVRWGSTLHINWFKEA